MPIKAHVVGDKDSLVQGEEGKALDTGCSRAGACTVA